MLSNITDLPIPMMVGLVADSYDYSSEENYISATQLLVPVKQIILSRRVTPENTDSDIIENASKIFGTAVHNYMESCWTNNDVLERALKKLDVPDRIISRINVNNSNKVKADSDINVYVEKRTVKEFENFKIGGKFDIVFDGMLYDYKTTSVYTYLYGSRDEDYQLQMSIYKWLNQDIITNSTANIIFIFTDWSSRQATINSEYPKYRIMHKKIEYLPMPAVEQYIRSKLQDVVKYKDADENDIPRCTDKELWREESVWKYYSNPSAVKATKVFKNQKEAYEYSSLMLNKNPSGYIKTVPGSVKRCLYCPCYSVCKQRREYYTDD